MRNILLKYLILILTFCTYVNLHANENIDVRVPYLMISCEKEQIYKTKLCNDFKLVNIGEKIKIVSDGNEILIDLHSVISLGVIYYYDEVGIEYISEDSWDKMFIYDFEGRLIRETNPESPDLSDLIKGRVYIVKKGGSSFKYIPYK